MKERDNEQMNEVHADRTGLLKNPIWKKIMNIAGNVLMYTLLAIALFILVITIVSKRDSDGAAMVFGYQLRFVKSDSMAECELTDVSEFDIKSIPVRSCIFVQVAPESEEELEKWYQSLQVGDVLTFKYVYTKQETITHRIVAIEAKETGGYLITLEGDNKNSESNLLQQVIDTSLVDSPNYIIGKVVGQNYLLGWFVYAFKTPIGLIGFIIVPCMIVIIFQVLRLVNVFSREKKEQEREKSEQQASEIELLRQQIAQLQQQSSATPAPDSAKPESEPEPEQSETGEEAPTP